MFPPELDYRRVDSLEDAVTAMATPDCDVRPVAGGQGLVPRLKDGTEAPDELVDVSGLDLAGIDVVNGETGDDSYVRFGALTTHRELAEADVDGAAGVLPATATHVADRQVRNHGTLGGNLAEADPAADLPAAVVAAGATLALRGPEGSRTVDAADFFHGDERTDCADDELLTAVRVPHRPDAGAAYVKKTHPASGYALVGVAAVVDLDEAGAEITDASVAVVGAVDRPTRLPTVESAVVGESLTGGEGDEAEFADAAAEAADDIDPARSQGDHHASAEFRAELVGTYSARALAEAAARAAGGGAE